MHVTVIFHSIKRCFNEEFPVESITKSLRRELLTRQEFSVDTIEVLVELEKFLDNPLGYYTEGTSDLFSLTLDNALKVNVLVFQ